MAYTQTDLDNVEAAIRAIVAGTRTVRLGMGDKLIEYTAVDLPQLQKLRETIAIEVAMSGGLYAPRTYAGQGGRG